MLEPRRFPCRSAEVWQKTVHILPGPSPPSHRYLPWSSPLGPHHHRSRLLHRRAVEPLASSVAEMGGSVASVCSTSLEALLEAVPVAASLLSLPISPRRS